MCLIAPGHSAADCYSPLCCCVQLRSSSFIDAQHLLKLVPHSQLLEVQALLHKHLGDHREALRSVLVQQSGCASLDRHLVPVWIDTLYALSWMQDGICIVSWQPASSSALSCLAPLTAYPGVEAAAPLEPGGQHCLVMWISVFVNMTSLMYMAMYSPSHITSYNAL